jgi:hypothetical protein
MIIEKMGDDYYKGYETSDSESGDDKGKAVEVEEEKEAEVPDRPEKLDKEDIAQMQLEDAIKERTYILSARSNGRFMWDVVIIIFAIVNAVTLPLDIAFNTWMSQYEAFVYLDTLTMVLFFVDIVFGFMTSYVNVA